MTGGGERKVGPFQFAGIFFHFYRLCKIFGGGGGRRGAGILYCHNPNLTLWNRLERIIIFMFHTVLDFKWLLETFRSDYEYEIYHLYLRAHARNVTE